MKFTSPAPAGARASLNGFFSDPRWVSVCDQFPDGLVVADASGLLVYLNPAAESLNEVRQIEWVGRAFGDFIDASQLGCDALREAYFSCQRLHDTLVDTGTRPGRAVLISLRVLRDAHNLPDGFLFFQRKVPAAPLVNANPAGLPGAPRHARALFDTAALWGRAYPVGLRAIRMNSRILLLGESGVGKTEFARRLHADSERRRGPFIHVSCAGIPESLFESEMFGYDRGSFTGALNKGKPGLIEAANGGVLFLDEIGEMALPLQAKLLLVLESGCVYRLGSTQPKPVDVQVIAATNRDLGKLIGEGRFRDDLYHRLNVITLTLAPLRARPALIGALLDHFLAAANERRPAPLNLSDACRAALVQYDYPGNVRELQNIVEYLSVVSDEIAEFDLLVQHIPSIKAAQNTQAAQVAQVVQAGHATHAAHAAQAASAADTGHAAALSAPPSSALDAIVDRHASLKDMVQKFEADLIFAAISRYGSKRKAAAVLQTDIATIVRKSKSAARD